MVYTLITKFIGIGSLIAILLWAATASGAVSGSLSNLRNLPAQIGAAVFPHMMTEDYFAEPFDRPFAVEETYPIGESRHSDWWVSSGAYLISKDGVGRTVAGNLNTDNRWFTEYRNSNPRDTALGARPQNIFRLVLTKRFDDFSQEMYARISAYDTSESEYRNESNGILFFNRYQDQDNLYYAGIRVDGMAVVKKKLNGEYTTLGIAPVFKSVQEYDRDLNPNLIPENQWIGLRTTTRTLSNGNVRIDVYIDRNRSGAFEHVLSAIDTGVTSGPVIGKPGYAGIRTDFMDVEFDDYVVRAL